MIIGIFNFYSDMQILKRLLYVVLIVPIFFVFGSVNAQTVLPNTIVDDFKKNTSEQIQKQNEDTNKTLQNTVNERMKDAVSTSNSIDTTNAQSMNASQKNKYYNCVKTRSKDGRENSTIKEACVCIAKGGILLSSDFPGSSAGGAIQGRCVYTNGDTVGIASQLFKTITKIVMVLLGITIFGMIVWGGMQFVIDPAGKGPENGKKMITNAVIAGFAISMIGVVLRFINPNIFK